MKQAMAFFCPDLRTVGNIVIELLNNQIPATVHPIMPNGDGYVVYVATIHQEAANKVVARYTHES